MEITNDNYYSKDAHTKYMSVSQFKEFLKCPAETIARLKGEVEDKKTTALLMGSYIDAHFSNEIDDFKKRNPEIFNLKTGELKSDFVQCEEIIRVIESDPMMMKYLNGEHQAVFTGEIAGVPFKGKLDSYFPGKLIVDQKVMRDMNPVWDEKEHCKKNFVEAWGYQLQGAVYRELVRQNTIDSEHPNGILLPFVLCIVTKEKVPKKALLRIDDEDLDRALEFVKEMAPIFQKMKNGEIEAPRCEDCDYCRSTAMITGVKSYHTFDPEIMD